MCAKGVSKRSTFQGVRKAEGRGSAATDVGANLRTTKIKWQQENKSLFLPGLDKTGWGWGVSKGGRRVGVVVVVVGTLGQGNEMIDSA